MFDSLSQALAATGKECIWKKKIMMMQNDLFFPLGLKISGICRWSQ